jgi:2-polyprenyl-3-methyl-5-hydroxy-6-metoxy-1,4-benzoquinol methylase
MIDLTNFPSTRKILTLTEVWPDHAGFVSKSLSDRNTILMRSTETWAGRILSVIAASNLDLVTFCRDYQFLCGKVLEEEVYFRRNSRYRLSTFSEANLEVYSNREFMDRYMNFLLLSHVLWDNHARAMLHFESDYLPRLNSKSRHLEIGPGHGLLLYSAAEHLKNGTLVGWDVSETSIDQTRRCMAALSANQPVSLILQNLFDAPSSDHRFDSVVLAEVLEHLEDPIAALQSISVHMAENALVWVHVPINSPAPDHLYLLRTPEEAVTMMENGGFEVVATEFYPMSGSTLEKARKQELTISAVMTARKLQ